MKLAVIATLTAAPLLQRIVAVKQSQSSRTRASQGVASSECTPAALGQQRRAS